jgi:hypothetical protein
MHHCGHRGNGGPIKHQPWFQRLQEQTGASGLLAFISGLRVLHGFPPPHLALPDLFLAWHPDLLRLHPECRREGKIKTEEK